ncbi:MAG: zinc dependent phospholipase C family protein [Cytophagaceae bacterium]
MSRKILLLNLLIFLTFPFCFGWGFFAHKRINHLAVFALPPELIGFYKNNISSISELAVNPDKRRYIDINEAPRHYIDLDAYHKPYDQLPKYWHEAVEEFTEDSLHAKGIVPWHIQLMKERLTYVFKEKNYKKIIQYSADLGHYIADAHVPLHTTRNYNGQLTNQHGIHGFWESRLPELFSAQYDCFIGKAEYIEDTQKAAWDAVITSHLAVDSVLSMEKFLSQKFSPEEKYSFEEKGSTTIKVYSKAYSEAYHNLLDGMVEKRMRAAIKMIADFWYTSWVDAGQPILTINDISEFLQEETHDNSLHYECQH